MRSKSFLNVHFGDGTLPIRRKPSVPIIILLKDIISCETSFETVQPFLSRIIKHSAAGKIRDKLGLKFNEFDTKSKKKVVKRFFIFFDDMARVKYDEDLLWTFQQVLSPRLPFWKNRKPVS